ncbi:MAG: hypothetical protein ACOC56_00785 [Atribacterota bacterium]
MQKKDCQKRSYNISIMKIGILAYGSLIDDPGYEIEEKVIEKRSGIRTPFRVEFARKSSSRDNAPTLVPVSKGGAYVEAVLLVLKKNTTLKYAKDILYRREINEVENKDKCYKPDPDNENQVWIDLIPEIFGMDYVLYTRIKPNIKQCTPENLAKLAIESVKGEVGKNKKDGISYLINAKENGIRTVLSKNYEENILEKTKSETLKEALKNCIKEKRGEKNKR